MCKQNRLAVLCDKWQRGGCVCERRLSAVLRPGAEFECIRARQVGIGYRRQNTAILRLSCYLVATLLYPTQALTPLTFVRACVAV